MKGIRIRLEETGLKASLFDCEAEIMEIVWSRQLQDFSGSKVHHILKDRREVAYTTVMTTLGRLCEKEMLDRVRDGRKYLYRARHSRAEFVREITREVMNSLPPLGQREALSMLVERIANSDDTVLDRIEETIRKQRKRLA